MTDRETLDKEDIRTLTYTNKLLAEMLSKSREVEKSARNENKKKIRRLESRLKNAVELTPAVMAAFDWFVYSNGHGTSDQENVELIDALIAKLRGGE